MIFEKAAQTDQNVFNFPFSSNHEIFQNRSLLTLEIWQAYVK